MVVVGVVVEAIVVLADMVGMVVVMVVAMSGIAGILMVVLAIVLHMVVLVVVMVFESLIAVEGENFLSLFQKDTSSNCTFPAKEDSPELLLQHQTFFTHWKAGITCKWMHRKALLRNAADENFAILVRHLLPVTNLPKVCQMTAD
ncbi:hypothetical protein PoB_000107300 [Plakobranchus ocellatus]|uniref:Uncharacterized protein n=1 Tax=Plakobranchus ocellatus TaxID=259542 RepID=A0AAV3XW33_9GAST|nr:hypothetical protein PoB_000107300 [Plakobranchus ocellatus]